MDDAVIDDDSTAPERQSLLPGAGFFIPDDLEREQAIAELEDELVDSEVAVIADTDADGLAAAAVIRAAYGEATLVPAGPHDLEEALARVAEHGASGLQVFVCDIAPERFEPIAPAIETLVERAQAVRWFDHHQWDDAVATAVREAGVDLVIGVSDEECTADVTLRSIDEPLPEHLESLVAVTRDHDLWIKEDPRSDDLADFARWSEDDETYVETVLEYGPDLPESVLESLEQRRKTKADRIDRAVRRAEFHEVGDWTVGVTYGRCSQNEVAERLREDGADAAVIVKPSGPASIRGTESFKRCHEVAEQVNGGGHPKAAGCKPEIYDDMLDYAHHWTTQGAVAKRLILDAFRTLAATD